MECYTWEQGELYDGIPVQEIAGDEVIYLGKHQKFWSHICVGMHPEYPPEINEYDGRHIYRAYTSLKRYSTSSGTDFVLTRPHPGRRDEDSRVMVLIDTRTDEGQGDQGFWRNIQGNARTLALGACVDDTGRRWLRGLIQMRPGDKIHISVADPVAEEYVLYMTRNGPETLTWDQYFGEPR